MKNRVKIIAEIGVNHNGDITLAKKLIDEAKKSGADCVKFQTFKADSLVTKTAKKAQYQNLNYDSDESQYMMLKRLELTPEMHKEIILYCEEKNIEFLSSGFDIESIDFLSKLGQKIFKIPSGEITNFPYLRHLGTISKSVILSTGMSNLNEIKDAIQILESGGLERKHITVLHCTSEYPAPLNEVNLNAMNEIKNKLHVSVGYSDHTAGIEVSLAAVALGAEVIEKHFTINQALPGPDHKASLEPKELKLMVKLIRNIEVALGEPIKQASKSEIKNMAIVRKSIVAKNKIEIGEIFTKNNLTTKRPGTGISPIKWDFVIGQKASRVFDIDELIVL
ncbi:N-acetylneuraminate synthase [Methylophilaceae bacterium]|jgi:N,N'-diacetyllegionaminate synthase|nr:N-acetylneuraminate synthase [Methylophilaceae bacterium]